MLTYLDAVGQNRRIVVYPVIKRCTTGKQWASWNVTLQIKMPRTTKITNTININAVTSIGIRPIATKGM